MVGQTVSLTLPSSSHADVEGYVLGGTLPMGLEFDDSKRQVTGTPTTVTAPDSPFSESYSAQDGADSPVNIGEPFVLTLTINVRVADTQPVFRSTIDYSMTVLEATAITARALPEAVSGNAPVTYSVSALPAGMTMGFDATTRELSGTPTAPGSYQITYTAKDQDGDTVSLMFTITVEANTAPAAPSIDNRIVTVGEVIAWTLPEGSGGNGALTYVLAAGDVAGLGVLTFNARTFYVQGTNPVPALDEGVNSQDFTLTYTVTDEDGQTGMTMFTITVNAAE